MQGFDNEHTFFVEWDDEGGYIVNGQLKPAIYLKLGETYSFNVDTKGHPFHITKSALGGDGGEGIDVGDVIIECNDTLKSKQHYYQCTKEKEMGYKIVVLTD